MCNGTPDQVGRDGSGIASGVMVEVLRVGVLLLLILVIASYHPCRHCRLDRQSQTPQMKNGSNLKSVAAIITL